MPAHSRLDNGVASLAYVAGIHVFQAMENLKSWMAGTKGRSRPSSTGYARP
jgi:hypothetical protein